MRINGTKYTGDFQVDSEYERDAIRESISGPTKYTREMTDKEAYKDAQRKYQPNFTHSERIGWK